MSPVSPLRFVAPLAVWFILAAAPSIRADLVYVVSFSTGELVRFDASDPVASRTTLVAGGEAAPLTAAAALAIGPDGNVYIGVNGELPTPIPTVAPTIVRYEVASATLSTIHTFAGFDVFPGSLAFRGNDLLVGRNPFYGNTGAIVRLANATGGTVVRSDYSSGGGLASSPGLALDAAANLYVSDQTYDFVTRIASGPVKRFDPAGSYLGEVIASGASGLAGPTGLVVLGGTLFTSSIMPGTVLQTSLGGDVTQPFGGSGWPFGTGVLAALSNGELMAGDPSGLNPAEIYRFQTDGALADSFSLGLGQVGGIATVAVPEPATLALAGVGLVAVAALVRRRRPVGRAS